MLYFIIFQTYINIYNNLIRYATYNNISIDISNATFCRSNIVFVRKNSEKKNNNTDKTVNYFNNICFQLTVHL